MKNCFQWLEQWLYKLLGQKWMEWRWGVFKPDVERETLLDGSTIAAMSLRIFSFQTVRRELFIQACRYLTDVMAPGVDTDARGILSSLYEAPVWISSHHYETLRGIMSGVYRLIRMPKGFLSSSERRNLSEEVFDTEGWGWVVSSLRK